MQQKGLYSRAVTMGVRPEHLTLTTKENPAAIECTIQVSEMMGSELHLHVLAPNGDKLIVRVPTVSLEDEQRKNMAYGKKIYVTCEGKVMHFFDTESQKNLLV